MSIQNLPLTSETASQHTDAPQVQMHATDVPEAPTSVDPAAAQSLDHAISTISTLDIASQPQSDLHRACAEGRLEDVRTTLVHGLDAIETLDLATGCTPIVLAIQNGHVDVVRELLAAGAIVPPPGITADPLLLSVLYPQPMYRIPPPFVGQMGPPQFYPQPGFFPGQTNELPRYIPYPPRKDSTPPNSTGSVGLNGGTIANLPPAEVAKTIPCRNFPNCKYGASCMFFHPRPQNPTFFPVPTGFVPSYEPGFIPYPAGAGPYFSGNPDFIQPNAAPIPATMLESFTATGQVAPQSQTASQQQTDDLSDTTLPVTSQYDQIPAPSHIPSALTPAFVPASAMPAVPEAPNGTPFLVSTSNGYPIGPLSPILVPSAPPPPPISSDAFLATSPHHPGFQAFASGYGAPTGPGRRQSFGQPFNAGGPKPFSGHTKKPSFSGGPKLWPTGSRVGTNSHLGTWKDGMPPPCAFFREGKCRNGEYCKFPHLDPEGNDCRHPDVVRGLVAPLPTRPRVMRMGGNNGQFDPSLRHQQQLHFMQTKAAVNGPTVTEVVENEGLPQATDVDDISTPEVKATTVPAETTDVAAIANATASATSTSLPPKPSAASLPSAGRSASQPGVARLHSNGNGSRSHSPVGSNLSYPGTVNGSATGRRGPRAPQANDSRSSSAGGTPNGDSKKPILPVQRIPRADEFPALGLGVAGTSTPPPTAERREPSWGSKTAAQVLSEPAPPKPVATKTEEEKTDEVVTMDSESEQDAVIVSKSSTPAPEASTKCSSVSFASVAGAVIASVDSAPVALKA